MALEQGWYYDWFANNWFPPVWFAPSDEEDVPPGERRQDGGVGHGKGKKKLRWIERDGKILIFNTPEEVELFIEIENRNIEEPITETEPLTESDPVNVIKPVEVIDKVEIKQLSKAYGYQRKLYHADQVGNIERVIAIYKELQQREDDDVETILMAML